MKPLLIILLSIIALTACSTTTQSGDLSSRKINVTTTVGMLNDIVKNVGGERVNTIGLMGPGVDPHLYKPTASDLQKLEAADVIFYGGLELEGRMTDVFVKLARIGKPTYAVSEDISTELLRQPKEFEGKYDPHIWFDVTLWEQATQKVNTILRTLDPGSKEYYQKNTDTYIAQLDELNEYVSSQIQTIPEQSRVLVTAHDAFGYFGDQYGMEVRGLQGTSTATEAGAADVQSLAKLLCDRGIKAIFVESSIPRATIEAVQKAAQAQGCEVSIGGSLYSDAMGTEGTPEGTYIGMVKHNVDTIVTALR
jgi:manganese/zinc/iron transport system substrate-binding protein